MSEDEHHYTVRVLVALDTVEVHHNDGDPYVTIGGSEMEFHLLEAHRRQLITLELVRLSEVTYCLTHRSELDPFLPDVCRAWVAYTTNRPATWEAMTPSCRLTTALVITKEGE